MGGQVELAERRRETEAVYEPKGETDQPSARDGRVEEQIFRRHESDGKRDHRLDQAVRQSDDLQHRERQGHAVSDRERRDDLCEREQPSAWQQQPDEEQQMVVPAQNVMDPHHEEAARRMREIAAVAEHEARLARVRGKRELLGATRGLDLCQGVVVGAEHVEDVVVDDELPHRAPASEVDEHREARGVVGQGEHLARARFTTGTLRAENDLGADDVEQLLAVQWAARLCEANSLGEFGRERRDRQGQAIADGASADRDRGVTRAPAGVGPCRCCCGQEQAAKPHAAEDRAHFSAASRSACSHSCPMKRDIR